MKQDRQIAASDDARAIRDKYPLTDGHTLVVPRRHVASLFELSDEEQAAVWRLAGVVRADLLRTHSPHGFNLGVNDGEMAGQKVMHAHVHVIPRYRDDAADPHRGMRWIVPDRAEYED